MKSLGAISISRNEFMNILGETVPKPTKKGNWNQYLKHEG
jgi:hypothetical protein